ncbi:hypothetical protein V1264_019330 [Littorina saxatilis]
METESHPLKVCVCGAAQENTTLLLHSLAAGDVLQNTQSFWLVLHDTAGRATDLEEQATSLDDACYPLLMGVRTECCLMDSLESCDVIVVLLQTAGLGDTLELLAHYAAAFNKVPWAKQKAVVIAGEQATTAAGVLCVLAPELSRHLVFAVDLPENSTQPGCGSYHAVRKVSECVRSWWTGLQEADAMTVGASVQSLSRMPSWYFLPLPVRLTGPQLLQINSSVSPDWENVKQLMADFNTAICHLRIPESELVTSLLSCKL